MKQSRIFTNEPLNDEDLFLRSIWPANKRPDYWNGYRLASSAFKDPKGLSVSRVYTRPKAEAVDWMKSHLQGPVYSITYVTCMYAKTVVKNKPGTVPYHYEIHGGENTVLLSDEQALLLARAAKRESDNE